MSRATKATKRKANGANGRRRANNTGTIEKRGNKWLARWYVYTPGGERLRRSKVLTASSVEEARKELRELTDGNALITREKEIQKGLVELEGVRAELQRIEDERPALTISRMFEAYRRHPNRPQCGAATLTRYEQEADIFAKWMSDNYPEAKEVRQVSREVAAAFLDSLSKRVSANTYNKYTSLLRLIWRTIGDEARCLVNPWDGVKRKGQPKTNGRRALTIEELAKVTADLTGEMRVLFALGIYTGLRLGDCVMMDWGSIDLVRRVIVTIPRKTARTGREVEIPIHPVLFAILTETPSHHHTGRVLPETAALYERDDSAVSKQIRAIFERAGIETAKSVEGYSRNVAAVGFHSLRHSFVSMMGNAGAPLALVQSIVGHSNPMMTAHYFHAKTDALSNAVKTLPALMGDTIDAEPAAPSTGNFAAFCAIWEQMTAEEHEEAQQWIAQREKDLI
jgi:integrase